MDYLSRAKEVFDIEIEALQQLRDSIDGSLTKAVETILLCLNDRGKIIVTGVGKSLHIAEKVSATLASTGATSVVLHPTQALHGDLGMIDQGDVVLAFSNSGASDEILAIVPALRRIQTTLIAITGDSESPLAEFADLVIPVVVGKEACPFNIAPTSSTTAALVLGDALAMALLDARQVKLEDFAELHPGGTIGRSLLLRIGDIMRTGDKIARVAANDSIEKAIVAMTDARSGSAVVVDEANKVLGIFTDGDLRRFLADGGELRSTVVKDVMTQSPKVLTQDQLAVDALTLFSQHEIDDVPVVDDAGSLVGSLDIQDLPKLRVV